MAVSESRKKANQKWDAANLDRISIAMPKGTKDAVKAAAVAAGESVNQYITRSIEQRMTGNLEDGSLLTPEMLKAAQEAAQSAGETLPAFVERAVETQAKRDKLMHGFQKSKTDTGSC